MFTIETYEEIYDRMKQSYIGDSGEDFDEASDIAVKLRVMAGEIFSTKSHIEWLKRQMFASTATGTYLDYIALQRGLERKKATKAKGRLTFTLAQAQENDFIVPAGSAVSTTDTVPKLFYTTEDATIPRGTVTGVAAAEAELAGYSGNIKKHAADVPISVPSGIVEAKNSIPFTGGTDAETDTALRERIYKSFISRPNGMNAAFYEQALLEVDGIHKAHAAAHNRGEGTITVFVCAKDYTLNGELLNAAQRKIDEIAEMNVNVQAMKPYCFDYDMTVTVKAKSDYTEEEVAELCENAFDAYIDSIDIGGKLYLSMLGKALLDTGCIENYQFDENMTNKSLSDSQCFTPGLVRVEVI